MGIGNSIEIDQYQLPIEYRPCLNNSNLYESVIDNSILTKYQHIIFSQSQLYQQYNSFVFRKCNSEYLLAPKYFHKLEGKNCDFKIRICYFLEYISYRLSQLNNFKSLKQAYYAVISMLQGFKILSKKFGYFSISAGMVFFFSGGTRVWINQDPTQATKSAENNSSIDEITFIMSILRIVDERISYEDCQNQLAKLDEKYHIGKFCFGKGYFRCLLQKRLKEKIQINKVLKFLIDCVKQFDTQSQICLKKINFEEFSVISSSCSKDSIISESNNKNNSKNSSPNRSEKNSIKHHKQRIINNISNNYKFAPKSKNYQKKKNKELKKVNLRSMQHQKFEKNNFQKKPAVIKQVQHENISPMYLHKVYNNIPTSQIVYKQYNTKIQPKPQCIQNIPINRHIDHHRAFTFFPLYYDQCTYTSNYQPTSKANTITNTLSANNQNQQHFQIPKQQFSQTRTTIKTNNQINNAEVVKNRINSSINDNILHKKEFIAEQTTNNGGRILLKYHEFRRSQDFQQSNKLQYNVPLQRNLTSNHQIKCQKQNNTNHQSHQSQQSQKSHKYQNQSDKKNIVISKKFQTFVSDQNRSEASEKTSKFISHHQNAKIETKKFDSSGSSNQNHKKVTISSENKEDCYEAKSSDIKSQKQQKQIDSSSIRKKISILEKKQYTPQIEDLDKQNISYNIKVTSSQKQGDEYQNSKSNLKARYSQPNISMDFLSSKKCQKYRRSLQTSEQNLKFNESNKQNNSNKMIILRQRDLLKYLNNSNESEELKNLLTKLTTIKSLPFTQQSQISYLDEQYIYDFQR